MSRVIYGRIPVKNAILSNEHIEKLYIGNSYKDKELFNLLNDKHVKYQRVSNEELNKLTSNANHQSVVALITNFSYYDEDAFLNEIKEKQRCLIVMLDCITDPVNFGSIIRTSCFFNCDGIVILSNRQVEVTDVVEKISTGATEFIKIVKVTNLTRYIEKLKDVGCYIYASSDKGATDYKSVNYYEKVVLIIGNEGKGVSPLVLKNSDFVIAIKPEGNISSLNANVACACMLAMIRSK